MDGGVDIVLGVFHYSSRFRSIHADDGDDEEGYAIGEDDADHHLRAHECDLLTAMFCYIQFMLAFSSANVSTTFFLLIRPPCADDGGDDDHDEEEEEGRERGSGTVDASGEAKTEAEGTGEEEEEKDKEEAHGATNGRRGGERRGGRGNG